MSIEPSIRSKAILLAVIMPIVVFILLFVLVAVFSFNLRRSTQVSNLKIEFPVINYMSLPIPGKLVSVSSPFAFSTEMTRPDFTLSLDSFEFGQEKVKELKSVLIDKSVKTWANSSNEIDYRKSEEERLDFDGILPKGNRGDYDFFSMNRFFNTQFAGLDKQFYAPISVVRKDKFSYQLELKPIKSDYNYIPSNSDIIRKIEELPIKISKENITFSELDCVATRVNGLNIVLLSLRGYDKTKAGNDVLDSDSLSCNLPNLDPGKKYYVDYYQRFMASYNGSDDAIEVSKGYWIDVIEGLGK